MSPTQQPKKMILLCCIIVTSLSTHLIHADERADYYKASDNSNLVQLNEREYEEMELEDSLLFKQQNIPQVNQNPYLDFI